jgi:hypothetical protein
MDKETHDYSRRHFIKSTTLAALSIAPLIGFLSSCADIDEEKLFKEIMDDDFHYFDNNLTNLHFYFINAKMHHNQLVLKTKTRGFMVVKIPQQHISEQLVRESELDRKDGKNDYLDNQANTSSKIAGFSFLAFELFPGTPIDEKRRMKLDSMDTLLDWDNKKYFELLINEDGSYKAFDNNFIDFKKNATQQVDNTSGNVVALAGKGDDTIKAFYKKLCADLFVMQKDMFVPVTLFEIPQGLYVTPYTGKDKKMVKAVFSKPPLTKQNYIYHSLTGKVIRSVQEIWNTQMWFQQFVEEEAPAATKRKTGEKIIKAIGEKYNTSLRPIAYLVGNEAKREMSECPVGDKTYLPEFIDEQELTYIASLGRKEAKNEDSEFNIEVKGLTFTGLGAITKFHYKNYTPPKDTSLTEYEHHITMGRDEYIKVARIGVIACTGQRAMHVKIGQRKIREGVSYMEFKEYIEIIQKEINYFDETLFITNDPNIKEPYNFIQARKHPEHKEKVIHSYDDIYTSNENKDEANDVWADKLIWDLDPKRLPENWITSYRRWMFKKVVALTTVSKPINTVLDAAFTYPKAATPGATTACAKAFWAVLEEQENGVNKDCTLDFIGYDWNNKPIHFSASILFIRKDLIEGGKDAKDSNDNKPIFKNKIFEDLFFNQAMERRNIGLLDAAVAYTPDFTPVDAAGDELPNKSNIAKTEFVEYYFSLCTEPQGKVLKYDSITGMFGTGDEAKAVEIFNERFFPLFPQVKRARLLVDNIQAYSPEPLASIIEYNNDFIQFGLHGITRNADGTPYLAADKKTTVFNKAKIIFNHTEKFRQGKEAVLEWVEETKSWQEKIVSDGYTKIKTAFAGAGDRIGGLVNPDFDLECIGLVKQSIAVGKKVNEKYRDAAGLVDKITNFNPADLLRQAPEIFKGISLLDILKEIFPDYEAPVNEIKNVASQVESELVNLPIVKKIQDFNKQFEEKINAAKDQLKTLKKEKENAEEKINDIKHELEKLNADLTKNFQLPDIENLVNNKIEEYKNDFLSKYNEVIGKPEIEANKAIEFVTAKVVGNTEKFCKLLRDFDEENPTGKKLFQLLVDLNNELQNGSGGDKEAAMATLAFKTLLFDGTGNNIELAAYKDLLIGKDKDGKAIFKTYEQVKESISILIVGTITDVIKEDKTSPLSIYTGYTKALQTEIQCKRDLIENAVNTELQNAYNEAAKNLRAATVNYRKLLDDKLDKRNTVKQLQATLRQTRSELVKNWNVLLAPELAKLENVYDLVLESDLFYWVEKYEVLKRNYLALQAKLDAGKNKEAVEQIISLLTQESEGARELKEDIEKSVKELPEKYKVAYNKGIDSLNTPGTPPEKIVAYISKEAREHQDQIRAAVNTLFYEKVESLKTALKPITDLKKGLNKKLQDYQNELAQKAIAYENKLNEFLNEKIDAAAKSLPAQVEEFIDYLNHQILEDPAKVVLINDLIAAKDLYNKLKSFTQKEVNFKWQTASFKNADFGIVAFLALENPKTTLSVNVKNTIFFQPDKFPSVISRIETLAENRLTNFGLSVFSLMKISFDEVSFVAGTNRKPVFDVKIRDVQFEGALSFVQAFEAWLTSLLGDAFRLRIQPTNVNIGYTLPIPSITTPGFNFFNLTLNFDFWLHFDNKPLQLGFSLARKDNKFGMTVGIYAGFGFFAMIAEPKRGITSIEIGFEFGGYFGLSLGPLRGEVKMVVGLYYKKDDSGVIIEGYFLCEGRVQLWFVMINARFYMGVRSQNNYVEGRCTVSYEIKLGCFFKLSFQASYYKKLAGATPGNDGNGNANAQRAQLSNFNGTSLAELAANNVAFKGKKANELSQILWNESQGTVQRKVKPVSKTDWANYINSYID